MRLTAVTALALSSLGLVEAVEFAELLRFASSPVTAASASPGSKLEPHAPTKAQVSDGADRETLDLRQVRHIPRAVPAPAVPANAAPAVPPAVPPAIPPAPPAANPLTPPTAPAGVAPPDEDPQVSVTVQWIETYIGTSRTWLPHTITLRNQALTEIAPSPGIGHIGLGTITGRLGVTRTVIRGAAKTVAPEWMVGAVAAMGLGIAGMV